MIFFFLPLNMGKILARSIITNGGFQEVPPAMAIEARWVSLKLVVEAGWVSFGLWIHGLVKGFYSMFLVF